MSQPNSQPYNPSAYPTATTAPMQPDQMADGSQDYLQFYQSSYADPNSYGGAGAVTGGGNAGGGAYYGQIPAASPGGRVSYEGYEGDNGFSAGSGPRPTGVLAAFGTGGAYYGDPPLLEELGINFGHIKSKTFTVLNPLKTVEKNIMDDTDLAGPLLFCFLFGIFLLLSGKAQFGYIYGLAALGCLSIHVILNLMSESGIDGYRTASVLGYCLLPMVVLSSLSTVLQLSNFKATVLPLLSIFSVLWCTYSASLMFVTVLSMSDQRLLVAYPVGLLYAVFALLTVF